MPLKNTFETYGTVAKSFHWLMALLIIGMLCVGFYMTSAEKSLAIFKLYGTHKSIGILILSLVTLRLVWRLVNVAPPLPASMPAWQRWGAHLSHFGLYALMFAMPLVGWMMSSAGGFTVSVFGWFNLPNLIAPDKERFELLRNMHDLGAWALVGLVSAHALAALYHHFIHHDFVLLRMLPFGKVKP